MTQETRKNERLEKYFVKAGTNTVEIFTLFNKLKDQLIVIKQKIYDKNANLSIIGDVLTFMD